MGLSPGDVDDATIWEFLHAVEGWQTANGAEDTAPIMDDDRLRELGVVGF